MKHFFHFFLASTSFFTVLFGTVQTTHAQWIVFDPKAEITRYFQLAEDFITSASTVTNTAFSATKNMNDQVLDPLGNALIGLAQIQQQVNTMNLIMGSLGGNSLLIKNPEQWIKNKGLNSVRINIGNISQQSGTYSSSILGSVVNTYRGTSNLQNTLASLGNSSIPNIVQNNLCKDASLSNIAKNNLMKTDGTYDLEAFKNRKQDLFNSLCVGNPNTSIALSRQLTEVGKQRPDIAGLDSLLAVSFGDNEYTRSVRAQLLIAEDKAKKEKAAEDNINRGGGVADATKCDQYATVGDLDGKGYETDGSGSSLVDNAGNRIRGGSVANLIPCIRESITKSGSVLNSAFQEAINAPLKKLQNTFGPGTFKSLGSILQIAASTKNLFDTTSQLVSSVDQLLSDSPSIGNYSRVTYPSTGSYSTVTYQTQDLTSPARQAETSDTVRVPLQAHFTSLTSLESTERNFLAELAGYQNSIQTIKICYETLGEDFNLQNDSRIISAFSFTSNKLAVIQSTQAESNKNLNSISTTRTLINNTLVAVTASKSTGEITTLFTDYQKKVDAQGLPSLSTASSRQSDLLRFQGTIRQENSTGGSIPRFTAECASIRQSYDQSNQG